MFQTTNQVISCYILWGSCSDQKSCHINDLGIPQKYGKVMVAWDPINAEILLQNATPSLLWFRKSLSASPIAITSIALPEALGPVPKSPSCDDGETKNQQKKVNIQFRVMIIIYIIIIITFNVVMMIIMSLLKVLILLIIIIIASSLLSLLSFISVVIMNIYSN